MGPSGTMEKVTVDLHAQVHFADENYFKFYNSPTFASQYDRVHYELIVDQDLLTSTSAFYQDDHHNDNHNHNDNENNKDNNKKEEGDKLVRTLLMPQNGLMPSVSDTQTALQYNLCCQVDVIDYSQTNWICADLSREEFYALQQQSHPNQNQNQPQQNAQMQKQFPGLEVLDALVRPTTPASKGIKTQLFSNLFLQGDGIAAFFRSLLWTTVPSPELSVMLLDWSSSSPKAGGISPIASPVIQSLVMGNLGAARKLIFSQMLVSGQTDDGAKNTLIGGRNDHALKVLKYSTEQDACRKNALIYGALHCRDLQTKLMQMGFQRKDVQWRTAWSVPIPGAGAAGRDGGRGETSNIFAVGAIGVPLYLAIGGLDWVATLEEMTKAFEVGHYVDGFFSSGLYVIRHVALYLGLAKFVVEWDGAGTGTGWGNERRK